MSLLLFRGERHMESLFSHRKRAYMAKATKPKRRVVQYTWKVTRRNNTVVEVTADSLGVVDGELVFTTNGIAARIIAADTYTDVELKDSAED